MINARGCPQFLRTNLGPDNSTVAFLQPLLQHNLVSDIYGKSTMNQVYSYSYCMIICITKNHNVLYIEDRGIVVSTHKTICRMVDGLIQGIPHASCNVIIIMY